MIKVNNEILNLSQFPDHTSAFRFDASKAYLQDPFNPRFEITWKYEGDHECILLWYLVNHVRSTVDTDFPPVIRLYMDYIPNARMDRVKNQDEVFTLKYFAEFLNMMKLNKVIVFDPHSNVAPALINRVQVINADAKIWKIINHIDDPDLLLCYPDDGANKKYSEIIRSEYIFGIKHRDWRSGDVQSLELITPDRIKDRNVLIIDDICSKGRTFTFTAKALKAAGAKDIYLYISHCEETIKKGTILTDGLIKHVYTTDSIYKGDYSMITVV